MTVTQSTTKQQLSLQTYIIKMNDIKTDTYFYIGKLSPNEKCMEFNPGEIQIGKGWILDIFMSGISLWNPELNPSAYSVRNWIKETFDLIVSIFNFLEKSSLRVRIENLIEARGVESKSNLIWWFYSEEMVKETPKRETRINSVWKAIGAQLLQIMNNHFHRMALKDYQNCIVDFGDDAFFFAYRALENIRRDSTKHMSSDCEVVEYWNEMHRILGTTQKQIKPLTDAAAAVRHGDFQHPDLIIARKNRDTVLNIGHDIMLIAFKKNYPGLIVEK